MLIDMASESQEIRAAAQTKILNDHQQNVGHIAALVEQYIMDDHRRAAAKDNIVLLGKLRAAEYVPLLVRNLTFEVFYKNAKRPQTVEDLYPAVQALIDIGSPSLRPVLERLKHEDGTTLQRAGGAVLQGILGTDWARAIITHEMQATDSASSSARLQYVLALMH